MLTNKQKKQMNNNFILRTVTGILFVIILVGGIIGGEIPFGILFLIITLLSVREFCNLVNQYEKDIHINTALCTIAGGVLFLTFYYYQQVMSWAILPFYLCFLIAIMVIELYAKKTNPAGNWAFSFMSQFYVALPFALLNIIAWMFPDSSGIPAYSFILPLSLFIFTWVNDTGAYCVGVTFGKHRLFERISPKKSWEGSFGGAIFCVIAAIILSHFYPILNRWEWIGFALVIVVFGTWGDLCESLMKRHWGIKDSGNILPGHGGMLDRFDSTLLAVPAVLVYLLMVLMVRGV